MNMNDYADAKNEARQEALAESLSAELRLERHLDMLQSNDGMIDQLRRNTDFAQTLMELVSWAVDVKKTSRRYRTIMTLADDLDRWARRGV